MKYKFLAEIWFMKTSTRIVKYESQVVKPNPVYVISIPSKILNSDPLLRIVLHIILTKSPTLHCNSDYWSETVEENKLIVMCRFSVYIYIYIYIYYIYIYILLSELKWSSFITCVVAGNSQKSSILKLVMQNMYSWILAHHLISRKRGTYSKKMMWPQLSTRPSKWGTEFCQLPDISKIAIVCCSL